VAQLRELSIAECGLGGDLQEAPAELGAEAAAAYRRGCAALLDVEAPLPTAAGEEPEEPEEPGDPAWSVASEQTPVALPLLAQLARPGCPLRRLDLSRSALSLATVALLARGLATTELEVLLLNRCSIGDEALGHLAAGLAQNQMLLDLQLRDNRLSGAPGAAGPLLDAAGRHARLAHLDLSLNPLSAECAQDLFAALRWSSSLVAVHVLGPVAWPGAAAAAAACRAWLRGQQPHGPSAVAEPPEAENEAAELVLCRALHVDGLGAWRMTSPAQPRPPRPAAPEQPELEPAPASWMPACCWICSRCAAVDYEWLVPDGGEGDDTGVRAAKLFVRPSFADFEPVELKRQFTAGAKRVRYAARLLVPPGQHYHLFEASIGAKVMLLRARYRPVVQMADAPLEPKQREAIEHLCRQHRYSGPLNAPPPVVADGFQIPEVTASENAAEEAGDPWEDDPERQARFRQCFDADIRELHLDDLCHSEEEEEVRATLWELYPRLYETYAIYAGRSQWPLVRHVDVYGFFDEARLLDRGGPPGVAPMPGTVSAARPLALQDVQQMVLQTFDHGRGRDSRAGAPTNWAAVVRQRTREGAPISRPQFIEVLLRAAIALRGSHPSTSRAFRRFADEVLSGRIMQPPLSPFPRGLPLQAGEVSDTLLSRRGTIREAWERFGCSENGFQRLAQLLKLCDRSFTAKHVASIYALARRPQADFRQAEKRTLGLRYDEFCEALARLALIWQRTRRAEGDSPGAGRRWPQQPQVGRPVRQIVVAARLEAFLVRLEERLRPAAVHSSVF